MGDTFQYAIFIEAGLEESIVLKLTLEPLVENSFKHGFPQSQENKQITIRCYLKDESIIMDCLDNGVGIDKDTVNRLLQSKEEQSSYALKNVHNRIKNAFGNPYGIEILEVESGAGVRIKIPWMKDKGKLNQLIEGAGS